MAWVVPAIVTVLVPSVNAPALESQSPETVKVKVLPSSVPPVAIVISLQAASAVKVTAWLMVASSPATGLPTSFHVVWPAAFQSPMALLVNVAASAEAANTTPATLRAKARAKHSLVFLKRCPFLLYIVYSLFVV
jgi:hypothetical protein